MSRLGQSHSKNSHVFFSSMVCNAAYGVVGEGESCAWIGRDGSKLAFYHFT